jgi:predicted methyltransferase
VSSTGGAAGGRCHADHAVVRCAASRRRAPQSACHAASFADAEKWAKSFDKPARDAWQRPDDVVRALKIQPRMTVADVGAGTGYFTVRLARAAPGVQVIATDIDPDMVHYVTERARREQLANVRAVPATADAPGLAPASSWGDCHGVRDDKVPLFSGRQSPAGMNAAQ